MSSPPTRGRWWRRASSHATGLRGIGAPHAGRRARPLGARGSYRQIARRRRIPVTRLGLGPSGTFAGDYPCHVMIISLLAWQQFGSKRCQTYVDGGGQVWT
jgi:hypothetical protein